MLRYLLCEYVKGTWHGQILSARKKRLYSKTLRSREKGKEEAGGRDDAEMFIFDI